MASSRPFNNKPNVASQFDNEMMFHSINESQLQLSTTEPNDGKLVVPFQIGNMAFHGDMVMSLSLTEAQENAKGPSLKHKNLLPSNFVPDEFDVICSRGKEARNHKGNILFHSIIKKTGPKYASAEGKISKSIIVSEIVDTFRQRSSTGMGFVKFIGGKWYELGDLSAREKVSQSLRDLLHGQYRSSARSKKRRKNELNYKMMKDLESLVDSNEFVSTRTKAMKETIDQFGDALSDHQLELLMTKMNCDILDQLKVDPELQRRFGILHVQSQAQARQT